jgi:hypothetical protein
MAQKSEMGVEGQVGSRGDLMGQAGVRGHGKTMLVAGRGRGMGWARQG